MCFSSDFGDGLKGKASCIPCCFYGVETAWLRLLRSVASLSSLKMEKTEPFKTSLIYRVQILKLTTANCLIFKERW